MAKAKATPKSTPFTEKRGHFSVKEYCITGKEPEQEVFDAIVKFHIEPMNAVRELYGKPISVSKNSGYRPKAHELSKGRPGTSEHTFEKIYPKGRGAADYTAESIPKLLDLLISDSPYLRICYYPSHGFIHCDYKGDGTRRELYQADANGKWKLERFF